MGIKKAYRLKSRKLLSELMKEGKRIKAFPVHLVFRYVNHMESDSQGLQVAFSAPKRIHRSAPQRNLVKRRMREAFRPLIPQFEAFMENSGQGLCVMLIYVGPEVLDSIDIAEKINLLLIRFQEQDKTRIDEQA